MARLLLASLTLSNAFIVPHRGLARLPRSALLRPAAAADDAAAPASEPIAPAPVEKLGLRARLKKATSFKKADLAALGVSARGPGGERVAFVSRVPGIRGGDAAIASRAAAAARLGG